MVTSSDPPVPSSEAPPTDPAVNTTQAAVKSEDEAQAPVTVAAESAQSGKPQAEGGATEPAATTTTTTTTAARKAAHTVPILVVKTDDSQASVEATPAPAAGTETIANDDEVNPIDFQGAVDSNNELPSPATLRKIENYIVLDRHGKSFPFKSLYSGKHVARRVLIIFVRHFFCGVSIQPVALPVHYDCTPRSQGFRGCGRGAVS
jgi:hypothetical protein